MDVRRQESVIGDAIPFPGRFVTGAAVFTALLISGIYILITCESSASLDDPY